MKIFVIFVAAMCAWRENRGGGQAGMQSVLNVLANRAKRNGTNMAVEALRPYQFSSMTDPNDPQRRLGPNFLVDTDRTSFSMALDLASMAKGGTLEDITHGATNYYAASMKTPPSWAASMVQTAVIEGQIFFKETA